MRRPLRLATRGSQLALIQSEWVAARLRSRGLEVELVPIVTSGDRRPTGMEDQEGWFTRGLREELCQGRVDLAVHSAKDLPIEERPPTAFVFPVRADARDALLTRHRTGLSELPAQATLGTDSVRRGGFLRMLRADLRVLPLHGNVGTRIAKLEEGQVDAIVLAMAGLQRLGREDRIDQVLEPDRVPPAPAQGALAIEVRDLESPAGRAVAALDDPSVRLAVEVERAVLQRLGGGCRSPVGALATVDGTRLRLLAGVPGTVLSRDGTVGEPEQLIDEVTRRLLDEEEDWR